nr:LysR substrate-binding domain-containing protein [Streptomyces sp. SID8379]
MKAELDAELFARGSRALTLTSAGQELLPYAQQSVDAADSGTRAVHSLGSLGGGTATFGVLRNADYHLLSNLVQMFHARYPSVRVWLVGQNSTETAAAVAARRTEAGPVVLPIDDEELQVTPLLRDEVHYVSATGQPVTVLGVSQFLIQGGRIVKEVRVYDEIALRAQINAGRNNDAEVAANIY